MIQVLLIEDDPGDARLIKELLAGANRGGFRVRHVDRLSTGLEQLAAGGIDVVLLDLSLPDSSGLGSFARVHALHPRVPIVVLPGPDDEELASRAMREGAQDYLPKGLVEAPLLSRSLRHALERQRAEEERERLVEELRETNQRLVSAGLREHKLVEEAQRRAARQEDLVRTISHDLRNPLTAILGQAQLLQRMLGRDQADPRLMRSADTIVSGAKRMNAMILDLVDQARLESDQLRLEKRPVELLSFLLELEERLKGVMEVERLRLEIPEGLPGLLADPGRLERILANLLSNAFKYSDPDTEVVVRAAPRGEQVQLSVTDQGMGIAQEDRAHLFERSYRATGTRKTEGLGLGLYISRMLVEAHGGRLWVESQDAKGSTFCFTLPTA